MKIKELISHLEKLDPEMQVIYLACSDYNILELCDLQVVKAVDQGGYVMRSHPTMSEDNKRREKAYLLFPGN